MRLDADVAARPGEPEATLRAFRRATAAVLVGTQLVAKGHDMPGVSLAAVLDADLALAIPDFRAEERTFGLLTQLAGRPGRPGDPRGRVLIQTWSPELRPIVLAARHAVAEFIEGELERRRELDYPPFRRLVRVLAAARVGGASRATSPATIAAAAAPALAGDIVLGPAPLQRLRDRSRSHVLIKTTSAAPRGRRPARPPARPRPRPAQGGRDGRRRRRPPVVRVNTEPGQARGIHGRVAA